MDSVGDGVKGLGVLIREERKEVGKVPGITPCR